MSISPSLFSQVLMRTWMSYHRMGIVTAARAVYRAGKAINVLLHSPTQGKCGKPASMKTFTLYRRNNLIKLYENYRVVANQKNSCVSQVEHIRMHSGTWESHENRMPTRGSRMKTTCWDMGVTWKPYGCFTNQIFIIVNIWTFVSLLDTEKPKLLHGTFLELLK
jgi:hypothetical protein